MNETLFITATIATFGVLVAWLAKILWDHFSHEQRPQADGGSNEDVFKAIDFKARELLRLMDESAYFINAEDAAKLADIATLHAAVLYYLAIKKRR